MPPNTAVTFQPPAPTVDTAKAPAAEQLGPRARVLAYAKQRPGLELHLDDLVKATGLTAVQVQTAINNHRHEARQPGKNAAGTFTSKRPGRSWVYALTEPAADLEAPTPARTAAARKAPARKTATAKAPARKTATAKAPARETAKAPAPARKTATAPAAPARRVFDLVGTDRNGTLVLQDDAGTLYAARELRAWWGTAS